MYIIIFKLYQNKKIKFFEYHLLILITIFGFLLVRISYAFFNLTLKYKNILYF
jgi:hypothetical protein